MEKFAVCLDQGFSDTRDSRTPLRMNNENRFELRQTLTIAATDKSRLIVEMVGWLVDNQAGPADCQSKPRLQAELVTPKTWML